ncbi:MAG: hypothetical protein SO314_03345, partial [Alphaproteobacteria bacterium]|nr:hypothetical protein [Alphaproteobacteria bacterium]
TNAATPAGLVQLLVRPVLQHLTQVVAADQPRMNAERRPVTILINHAAHLMVMKADVTAILVPTVAVVLENAAGLVIPRLSKVTKKNVATALVICFLRNLVLGFFHLLAALQEAQQLFLVVTTEVDIMILMVYLAPVHTPTHTLNVITKKQHRYNLNIIPAVSPLYPASEAILPT